MNRSMTAVLCRLLIVLVALLPVQASAGMIGTEAAATAGAAQSRALIVSVIDRADVAARLQALGVTPGEAIERVHAMNDGEARYLAGQLESAPAGGLTSWGMLILIIAAIFAINWFLGQKGVDQK